jgi:thioredoxin reductase (NADPH)
MSHYLIDRLERSPRIEVMTETEVAAVHGSATVESVTLRSRDGGSEEVDCDAVPVMIGAEPCTEASDGMLAVDDAGYLLYGDGALVVRFAYQVLADSVQSAPA